MKLFEAGSLFSYKGYRLFWFSNAIFVLGASAFPIALAVTVLDAGGTATSLGLILGARVLSGVVFAPFAGVWADRLPRRNVMIGADLFRAAVVISMVFVSAPSTIDLFIGERYSDSLYSSSIYSRLCSEGIMVTGFSLIY